MGKTERLQLRIDPETKSKATALFADLDITITDAVTLFLHEALTSGGRPFTVDVASLSQAQHNYARTPRMK